MQNKTFFTATEARQHFFELLRLAEKGKTPIVFNKNRKVEFKLTAISGDHKQKDIKKILKEMRRINFKIMPLKKMKKIIVRMHNIKV
jgi:antitoxin (DNA-binding transcriptional repressor) of toxin-antitoxin stability system